MDGVAKERSIDILLCSGLFRGDGVPLDVHMGEFPISNPPAFDRLTRVRIVLVRTSHPGNIGATARAMHTMGLTRLTLVAPKHSPQHEDAIARAAIDDVAGAAGSLHRDREHWMHGMDFPGPPS